MSIESEGVALSNSAKKFLILNADDFGVNPSTNKAILELFEKGLITSASLLTVAQDSKDAAKLTFANKLPVGVHLTINSDDNENRWHSNSQAKSLSDNKGLLNDNKLLALKAKSKDVTQELEAQYRFMVENGCMPDHADNHCGTLYGINGRLFFINAFRFCKKYSLPFRFPKSPAFLERQLNRRVPSVLVLAHKMIVNTAKHYDLCLPDDIISNPYSIKKIKTYDALRAYYVDQIKNMAPGITEVFLHPSYPIGDAPSSADNEWLKREFELQLLQSWDLLQVAADKGILVCSWGNAPFHQIK